MSDNEQASTSDIRIKGQNNIVIQNCTVSLHGSSPFPDGRKRTSDATAGRGETSGKKIKGTEYGIISIKEAMEQTEDTSVNISCKVLNILEKPRKKKASKVAQLSVKVEIADEGKCVDLKVFNEQYANLFKKDAMLILENVLVKKEFMIFTKLSSARRQVGEKLDVPQKVLQEKQVDITPLTKLLSVGGYGTIEGTVIEVFQASPKFKQKGRGKGKEFLLREIRILDTKGNATLTLWGELASLDISKGSVIRVSNVTHSEYEGKKKLTTSKNSEITLQKPAEDAGAIGGDGDASSVTDNRSYAIIDSFTKIAKYDVCKRDSCQKFGEKVNKRRNCNKCRKAVKYPAIGLVGTVKCRVGGAIEDYSIFLSELKKIAFAMNTAIDVTSEKENICEALNVLIPIRILCSCKDGVLNDVEVISKDSSK